MRLPSALTLLVWGSCYAPSAPLGVPCSETGACPTGQECDQLTQICMAPTEVRTWRDDSAEDFAQPDAVLVDGIIEPGGFVGPVPYATGRIRLSAIAADTIGTLATATWATASAGTVTGRALMPTLDLDYGDRVPPGLGLASGDNVTILIEGELNLDATGVWGFELNANDKGFIELAPPNGEFVPLVSDEVTGASLANYTVTQTGWHRFRAAFSDTSIAMSFELRVDSPAAGGLRVPETDRMRAPVGDLAGYVADGFDYGGLLAYTASTLDPLPLDRQIPADLFGIPTGTTGHSYRWSGQILIETEGDYAFELVSFHGHRMWIDGVQVANALDTGATTTSTTEPIHLVAGWHDLVADVTKDSDSTVGQMTVTVASGPQFVGQPIPADHVRPVVGRAARWVSTGSLTAVAIPDGASINHVATLESPLGFVPSEIEVGYQIDHPARAQVSVTLDPPGTGANIPLLAAGDLGGAGLYNARQTLPASSFGAAWTFTFADSTVDAIEGDLELAAVTAIGRAGVAPFPTQVTYESSVRELGNVVGFGPPRWQLRQGATAEVSLRTCDDAAACAAEPWTTALPDAVPAVMARRFAQYRVRITTDGDVPTALDWIELTYSVRPE